jgi:hypothetical protein
MSTIQTRYAKSAEVHIAYQVVGEGQVDLWLRSGARRATRINLATRGVPEGTLVGRSACWGRVSAGCACGAPILRA